nr:hypothetical protein CFP56_12875 [Quercus suber]
MGQRRWWWGGAGEEGFGELAQRARGWEHRSVKSIRPARRIGRIDNRAGWERGSRHCMTGCVYDMSNARSERRPRSLRTVVDGLRQAEAWAEVSHTMTTRIVTKQHANTQDPGTVYMLSMGDPTPNRQTLLFPDTSAPLSTVIPARVREASIRPGPVGETLGVHAGFIRIIHASSALVKQLLPRAAAAIAQDFRKVINGKNGQRETIGFVADRQFERSVDVAFLLVATDVHEVLALAVVRQAMHKPWVRVEVEHDGLVVGEDGGVLLARETVWMVAVGDELEEIDDIDESNFELGEMLTQQSRSRQRFLRRGVTAASHHDIWLLVGVGRSPFPDSNTLGTMRDCIFHVEILQMYLLVSHDDVHIIRTAEAMVHRRE